MKSKKLQWIVILFILLAMACNFSAIPVRSPQDVSLTINTKIPQKVEQGYEYEFEVITDINNNCFAGVKYLTTNDEWKVIDFEAEIADKNGMCRWKWKVPVDAKNGFAEFRAYVEKDQQTNYSLPDDFCINICQ